MIQTKDKWKNEDKYETTQISGWKRVPTNKTLNDDLLAIDLNTNEGMSNDIITSKVDQII